MYVFVKIIYVIYGDWGGFFLPDNLINEAINQNIDDLAEKFFFRKLGVCYDYRCGSSGFPSQFLPKAKDVSSSLPDACGTGTGMFDSLFNNTFLLETLALRFELGIARASEDRILDRLIGGAIRFSTIGPKSGMIRGLAPDGRSFYPDSGDESFVLWAYYAWRTCNSPAVAIESQGKLSNIASRWINSLNSADFVPPASDKILGAGEWYSVLYLPALQAAVGDLASEEKWKKLALEKLPAEFPAISDAATARQLLDCMLCLNLLFSVFPDEAKLQPLVAYRQKLIAKCENLLTVWKDNPCADNAEMPELDWRTRENGDQQAGWERLQKEADTLGEALLAASGIMLCAGNDEIVQNAAVIEEMLRGVCWSGCWNAQSLILSSFVHARGVELQLWDKEISEYQITFDTSATLVEKFMAEDYDEKNPDLAGHTEAQKPVVVQEEPEAKSQKRPRKNPKQRNPSAPQPENTENAAQSDKSDEHKRPPRKRRRRKKKRPAND